MTSLAATAAPPTSPTRERGTDPARDSLLAGVVDEYLAACRAGERPDIDALIARHPEIAADLAACLASLDFLENIAQQERLLAPPAAGEHANENGNGAAPRRVEGTLGDYRILGEIGRGGMGVVYEAQQISLNRRVALKVLPFAAILDDRAKKRFQNEALAAAQLDHPHIVDVYGVGCERGVHYYAMRLIEGRSLAEIVQHLREQLEANPKFVPSSLADLVSSAQAAAATQQITGDTISSPDPSPQSPAPARSPKLGPSYYRSIATLGMHVAEALDHAHEQGVLHRDIKPSNLMLDSSGKVWITDFGLARLDSAASLTHTGDLLGTLRYMSPEQALAQHVPIDHRSDIYSLGVTLYELLTLQPAFDSDNRGELLRQVAFEEPTRPRKIDPQIPQDLETILLKTIEKNPAERYQTATDLAADLKRFVDDRHIQARQPSLYSRALKWSRRHVEWVVSASLIAVILLAATTLVTLIAAARERERTTERLRLNQEIGEELRQAVSLTQTANSAKGNDRLVWGQAREHAHRAAALAKNEAVDTTLRQEVATVLTDLDERQRDWALLAAIDSAWLAQLDTNQGADEPTREKIVPIFAEAIASFGIEMGRESPEASARKIGSRPRDVQLAIITILDELLYYPEDQRNPWIEKVLLLADQNAWRAAKRTANKIAAPKERLAALQKLAAAKDVDDQPAMVIAHLGAELNTLGDNSGAIAVMRSAAQRNPSSAQLNHYLGYAFSQATPPQLFEAIRYANTAASLQPKNPLLITYLGNYLRRTGKLDEALVHLRAGLLLKPDSPLLHLRLADLLKDQGQREEAVKEYRLTIQLLPDFGGAYLNLGVTLYELRKLDEALAAYDSAIHFWPDLAEAHNSRGIALRDQGKLAEALVAYDKAIQLKPNLIAAHSNRGIALVEMGRLAEALAAYDQAILLDPNFAAAHANRGNALWQERRIDEATAAFQQAIRIAPGHAGAQFGLQLVKLDAEFEEFLKGTSSSRSATESLKLATFALAERQLPGTAVKLFEQAFAEDPSLAEQVQAHHRYNAACAALLRAAGKGKEADQLEDAERTRFRHQAIVWLKLDLACWEQVTADAKPDQLPQILQALAHWQKDPDLASLRDEAGTQQLSAEDQGLCKTLWADHTLFLERAMTKIQRTSKQKQD